MARGNATALALGPGFIYTGPLGTTEPSDLTTPWTAVSASWGPVGYTEQGSEFQYNPATSTVEVAEELDPMAVVSTGRASSVAFNMAEITAKHLSIAMNGGTITAGTGVVTYEPPDLGNEVRIMIGFESEDHTERWVYRQCFQTGTISIPRRKGNANATMACTFSLEKPASGAKLYKAIFAVPLRQ